MTAITGYILYDHLALLRFPSSARFSSCFGVSALNDDALCVSSVKNMCAGNSTLSGRFRAFDLYLTFESVVIRRYGQYAVF